MTTIENPGTDTPTEAIPSSVGPLSWPPSADKENNRKRGVFRRIIDSPSFLNRFIHRFSKMELSEDITRISGRIFVTNDSLISALGNNLGVIDPYIEAVIPLQGSGVSQLEDVSLVYLGKNAESRMLPSSEIIHELETAKSIFTSTEPSKFHSHEGIDFTILNDSLRTDVEIQRQFNDLYSAFGWNEEDVAKILNNQNNLLVGAFKNAILISTGMAERAEVNLIKGNERFDFVMYEITEAATREEFRGNGLYLAVALIINRLLSETDANLVFGESNLAAPGVLKAAYRQGRHSALNKLSELGLTEKPLRQPVRISAGINDKRPKQLKNDLLVTYLTRDELIKRHGKPTYAFVE